MTQRRIPVSGNAIPHAISRIAMRRFGVHRKSARRAAAVVGVTFASIAATTAAVAPATAAPIAPTTQVASCGSPAATPNARFTRTTTVNGVSRSYRVHVPAAYRPGVGAPVIIAFYGRGERSADFEKYTRLSSLPAIVVYPEGLRGRGGLTAWQSAPYANVEADDVAFTRQIISEVSRSACVDRSRVYAVGRSNGGGMVSLLACRMPGSFAAFAAVSGAFYAESTRPCSSAPVSMIEFHGTADPVIHYDGGRRFSEGLPSIPEWLAGWTSKAHCAPPLSIPINASVTRLDWPVCSPFGTQVTHYRITGGGHRWPGSTGSHGISDSIDATSLIWQFFSVHPLG